MNPKRITTIHPAACIATRRQSQWSGLELILLGFNRLLYEAAADFVLIQMIAIASRPYLTSDRFTTVQLVACTARLEPKATARVWG